MDIDILVSEAFDKIERDKGLKKMQKAMLTKVLVGVPNVNSYSEYNYKRPLSEFQKEQLQSSIDRIKNNLKTGEVILNTNLETLGIKI